MSFDKVYELTDPVLNGINILATYFANKFYFTTYDIAYKTYNKSKIIYKSITDVYRNILNTHKDLFNGSESSTKNFRDYLNGIVTYLKEFSAQTYAAPNHSDQLAFICSIFIPTEYISDTSANVYIKEIMKCLIIPCSICVQENINLVMDARDDSEVALSNVEELKLKLVDVITKERHKFYIRIINAENKIYSPTGNINDALAKKTVEFMKEIAKLKTENAQLMMLFRTRITECNNKIESEREKLKKYETESSSVHSNINGLKMQLDNANRMINQLKAKISDYENVKPAAAAAAAPAAQQVSSAYLNYPGSAGGNVTANATNKFDPTTMIDNYDHEYSEPTKPAVITVAKESDEELTFDDMLAPMDIDKSLDLIEDL